MHPHTLIGIAVAVQTALYRPQLSSFQRGLPCGGALLPAPRVFSKGHLFLGPAERRQHFALEASLAQPLPVLRIQQAALRQRCDYVPGTLPSALSAVPTGPLRPVAGTRLEIR